MKNWGIWWCGSHCSLPWNLEKCWADWKIKESAKINIAVLDYVAEHIKAGISTAEIDKWVYDITTKMGGVPAPLNFEGFPKSVCTSINNEVCHGIPSEDVIIKDGDIINVDVSTNLNGYFSDSSRMFCIGNVSEENRKLVEETKMQFMKDLNRLSLGAFSEIWVRPSMIM